MTETFPPWAKRLFEIIPGLLTWAVLLLPLLFSFRYPGVVASFILVFDLYWFLRSLHLALNISRTYRMMKTAGRTNWLAKLEGARDTKFQSGLTVNEVYQAIIIVMYKEPYELLEASVASYVSSHYNLNERMYLVLGIEERAEAQGQAVFKKLKAKFGDHFKHFAMTVHPKDLPGEIKCKSANATWAAKYLLTVLQKDGITPKQTIVHNFDADTRVHKEYFAYVQWNFLHTPSDQPTSYQPIHLLTNNIWDTGTPMRLIAIGSSFAVMHNALIPDQLYSFSSRSDCFQTIVDIGYWTVSAIPEDSRQYYDAFFRYKGNITVQPQFVPVYMDAVLADTYKQTIVTQYTQLRRWAWGVVDFPYVAEKSWFDRDIPWSRKLRLLFNLIERHLSWATVAIYLSLIGWVPVLLSPNFNSTVISHNFLTITHAIFSLSTVGFLIAIYIGYLLMPRRSSHHTVLQYIIFLSQWFLVPVFSICFNSAAAIDAQTRLMFGRYMEYEVTEKSVARSQEPQLQHGQEM